MSMHIECENGHKLICPDSLAGSSVICPKCGSRVDVTARNVAKGGRAVSEAAVESISGIHKKVAVVATAAPPGSSTKLGDIAFSCPNGHRLTAPRSLAGGEGECPKCKTKFRVPDDLTTQSSPKDTSESSTSLQQRLKDSLEPTAAASTDDDLSLDELEEIDVIDVRSRRTSPEQSPIPVSYAAETPPHPLVQLFARLWKEREHGGLVELHLDNGVTIAPDWWSERQSTKSFAVFALQTDDETYEIHAIAWPHVRRVTVKGLKELPDGVFDE